MFVIRFVSCSFFEHRFYTIESDVSGRSKRIHFKYVHHSRVGAIKLQIIRRRKKRTKNSTTAVKLIKGNDIDAHTLPTPSSKRIRSYQKRNKNNSVVPNSLVITTGRSKLELDFQ